MDKILKIENDIVVIGTKDNSLINVERANVNFDCRVGDLVDVFQDENTTFVTKHEGNEKVTSNQDGAININIENNQEVKQSSSFDPYLIGKKRVKKSTYLILCIFLGVLGIHKFYAGKTVMGIIYFFTFGLFLIGWVVDIVVAIGKKADSQGYIYF